MPPCPDCPTTRSRDCVATACPTSPAILAVGDRLGIERQLDDHALVNAAHQLLDALPPRRERTVRRHVHRETELVRLVDVHPHAEVRVTLVPARVVLNRLHVRRDPACMSMLCAARVDARAPRRTESSSLHRRPCPAEGSSSCRSPRCGTSSNSCRTSSTSSTPGTRGRRRAPASRRPTARDSEPAPRRS